MFKSLFDFLKKDLYSEMRRDRWLFAKYALMVYPVPRPFLGIVFLLSLYWAVRAPLAVIWILKANATAESMFLPLGGYLHNTVDFFVVAGYFCGFIFSYIAVRTSAVALSAKYKKMDVRDLEQFINSIEPRKK